MSLAEESASSTGSWNGVSEKGISLYSPAKKDCSFQ